MKRSAEVSLLPHHPPQSLRACVTGKSNCAQRRSTFQADTSARASPCKTKKPSCLANVFVLSTKFELSSTPTQFSEVLKMIAITKREWFSNIRGDVLAGVVVARGQRLRQLQNSGTNR